jgi:hypothetical protein
MSIYKTDANNQNVLWKYELPDTCFSNELKVFMNEIYIIANYYAVPRNYSLLIKLAANGSILFIKKIKASTDLSIASICITAQKKIYLGSGACGYTNLIISLDSTGNHLWSKTYNFPSGLGYISSINLDINSNSELYVSSFGALAQGGHRIILQYKINSLGNVLWNRFYLVPFYASTTYELPISRLDASNNIYGIFNINDSLDQHCYNVMYKMDSTGNLLWSNRYSHPASPYNMVYHFDIAPDNSPYMVSYYNTLTQDSTANLIIKINNDDGSARLVLSDYTLTAGRYTLLRIKAINANKFILTTDINDALIASMDSLGIGMCNLTQINLNAIPFPLNEVFYNLTTDAYTFNVADTSITLVTGSYYLIPYCTSIGISEIYSDFELSIYPNPATENIFIERNSVSSAATLEFFDSLGRKAEKTIIPRGERNIIVDVNHLASGIYFVKLTDEKTSVTGKVIVQH